MFLQQLRIAVITLALLSILTGILYPFAVTGVAQLAFHEKANGSFIKKGGKVAGSELIGQPFTEPGYFWGRLSATSLIPYNAAASTGSNLGVLNPALLDAASKRAAHLRGAQGQDTRPIPVDLLTASGSGLDPHISAAAAIYQVPRVARARNMPEKEVQTLVDRCTEGRQFGFLGEPRVNVLQLNLALDEAKK